MLAVDFDARTAHRDPHLVNQPHLFICHRITGQAHNFAGDGAVFRKRKCIDLDLGLLADFHEADVFVLEHGFDFHRFARGNDHHQLLRRGDDRADAVNSQLLNYAIYRGGDRLGPDPGFGLDPFLPDCRSSALYLIEVFEDLAVELDRKSVV